MTIKGLFTALITPFKQDGSLDEKGLEKLIAYQIDAGVDGLVVLGTTGETPTLDHEEKLKILSIAKSVAKGKIHLMVGCATNCTKTTIESAIEAEKMGADSLIIVTPYYNKPTQEGIFLHYKAIAEKVTLPICVYNIAGRCGVNIETATLERLAEIPNIVAVKEASGNILQMNDVIFRVCHKRKDFTILSGDDALTLPLLAIGGHGLISVISNIVPRTVKAMIDATATSFAKARELHFALKPICEAAFLESNPIPIKRMLALSGLPAGKTRLPLWGPMPAVDKKLAEIVKNPLIIEETKEFQK